MMVRTQILLPQAMLAQLRIKAKEEKTSVSSIVRESVQKYTMKNKKKKMTGYELLTYLAEHPFSSKTAPKDLSTNDDYLYGDL